MANVAGEAPHMFVTNTSEQMVDLGALPQNAGGVNGINDNGQLVGTYWNGSTYRAFRQDIGGTLADVGTLGGETFGFAINAAGQVTGQSFIDSNTYHAFRAEMSSAITDLGALSSAGLSYGTAINSSVQVTGNSHPANAPGEAFVTDAGSKMTNLGTLSVAGVGGTSGGGINDAGAVVGTSISRGFVTINGIMSDLNQLVDASGTGWTIESAVAINKAGQIVGDGFNAQGTSHAILLTPTTLQPPIDSPSIVAPPLGGLSTQASHSTTECVAGERKLVFLTHGWQSATNLTADQNRRLRSLAS